MTFKGTIKAISTKNSSILLEDGDESAWFKCEDVSYARKGLAEITLADDGQTVKFIKMLSSGVAQHPFYRYGFHSKSRHY